MKVGPNKTKHKQKKKNHNIAQQKPQLFEGIG